MTKYIALLLAFSVSFFSNLWGSSLSADLTEKCESAQIEHIRQNPEQVFQEQIINHPGYDHFDEVKFIRTQLNDFVVSAANSNRYQEDFEVDADFKNFLSFVGVSADGSYDLNDKLTRQMYIVHRFYLIDHVVHQILLTGFNSKHNLILDGAYSNVFEQISKEPLECRFKDCDGIVCRIDTALANSSSPMSQETIDFVEKFREITREGHVTMVQTILLDPALNHQSFLSFMDNQSASLLYQLTTTRTTAFDDAKIIKQIIELYGHFLQKASTLRELHELKASLVFLSSDFYDFSQDIYSRWPTQSKHLIEAIIKYGLDFWIEWVAQENTDIYPITVVDRLFIRGFETAKQDLRFSKDELNIENFPTLVHEFQLYLNGLEETNECLNEMLRFINIRSKEMHNKYVRKFFEVPKFKGRTLPSLSVTIDKFYKRLEAKKQAEAKAKTQSAANDLYGKKFEQLATDKGVKVADFVKTYPCLKNEEFKIRLKGNANYKAFIQASALIESGSESLLNKGPVDLVALKEMMASHKSLDATLKALGNDLDQMLAADKDQEKDLKKKESKFLKKRKKDEAKALKKELRAKQKAEERAKRASTQLAPSPDPSPYPSAFPSVHADLEEKRLSRAEIAEKHMRQSQKDEEKRNSKSLRQSFKDLFHIGQADEQTDKRDSKRFSRSSKRPSEIATTHEPLDLSQHGAIDRQSLKADIKDLWEGRKQLANANDQKAFVEILDALNLATDLGEIRQSFSHGDNFEQLNSGKIKSFNYKKKDTVYSIRLHGKSAYRICFTWDGTNKKVCNVQYGDYH